MADLADELTSDDDERLDQAQGVVRTYCGWDISPVRTGDTYQLVDPSSVILLPTIHLLTVDAIDDGTDTVYVEGVDYYTRTSGVVYKALGSWPSGTTVTFSHGYADVPAEVRGVVQAIAQRAVANPLTLAQEQVGPFVARYGSSRMGAPVLIGLTDGEMATLDAYRITEQ